MSGVELGICGIVISGQDVCTQSTCVCKDAIWPFLENPNEYTCIQTNLLVHAVVLFSHIDDLSHYKQQ